MRKLGKKLGVVHDPRTLQAMAVLQPSAVRVPSKHRIAHNLVMVPMFANDQLGDCTQASKGHAIVTMENSSGQGRRELPVTDAQVIAAYERIGGYRPGHPETDNGAYELDSLKDWRNVGLGMENDYTAHRIRAFAAVDWTDHRELLLAHYVFGGLKVCAALPLSAQRQDIWDVSEGPDARFGSWGGHSMYSPGYDRDHLYVWTWGALQAMTWAWVERYVDECYAVISEDYVRRSGRTPQGFNPAALDSFLSGLGR